MEIELLKTFQHVAQLGSISKTADEMYLSVSTVTSRIQKLEGQLNIELFHRVGRRLQISADGKKFLVYVERFLNILDEGCEKISVSKKEGELNIAVSSNITNYILPGLIRRFKEQHPYIRIRIVQSSNHQLVDRISDGYMELGIANHFVNEGGVTSQLWFKDRIVPILAKGHPLSERKTLCPEDIKPYLFIGYASHTRKWKVIKDWFAHAGIEPRVVIEVDEVGLVKKFVKKMGAITFLPYISVKRDLNKGSLITIPPNPPIKERDTVFVFKRNLELSQAAKLFMEFAQHARGEEHHGIASFGNLCESGSVS
ncbi:LysR family transcriptional regulator [Ammoniphilus sp. YIM 78166]|uniref:LysR family transcriptional regulator n=1 Tax=Ammoniphilus sp. YIM 78166 TaxID=1644106 RepID=UPI00106F2577|nr:LysR family transcriptional regulator [Ammoniphilus sp. YIM 78166]